MLADEAELAGQLQSLINSAREKELDKLKMLTQQAAKDNLEQIINKPIYSLDHDFWDQMRVPYVHELSEVATNTAQLLHTGFACSDNEIVEFMRSLDQNLG